MKNSPLKDPMTRNIIYLSLLVLVLSLQALIVIAFIYQFVPVKLAAITQGVPEPLLKLFKPNHNILFYHAFIFTVIIGQFLVFYTFRKNLKLPELAGKVRNFLICETCWVMWQIFAIFKILQYQDPHWARVLLYAGFAAALLAKIFWTELNRGLKRFETWAGWPNPEFWYKFADGGIIILLLSVILIPDTEKALLRIAVLDSNNHFDQWLMAPLWAYHKGLVPALQAFVPLNWGVPVLINALVNLIGGVTYGHVIEVLCLLAVIYYTVFYYLLRSWLGVLPAAFGVLLAVKLQMFNAGVSPLIWTFPGESVLRHLFDVAVFFCLLLFAQGKGELFLWLAGAAVGISLAFVFDTGAYMAGALYAYIAVLMSFQDTRSSLCPNPRQWRKILGLVFLPWLMMLLMLLFCFGPAAFHSEFWTNSFKDFPRWLKGLDAVSIFSCLGNRNFFAFFASFFPPLIYTAGMTAAISMVFFRRWKSEALFLIPLSVYGLGVYAHFLWHATINYYYMVPLPLAGCVCFWGTQAVAGIKKSRQLLIKLILVFLACIALFSNYLFTYYPNIFDLAGENWDQQKAYYRTNFNFSRDAEFIGQWEPPGARVALISGFATQVLLQADREPFFYGCLPLMSVEDVYQLLNQLDRDKPGQVFVDKGILNSTNGTPLYALADYLNTHYQFSGQQNGHLALLQRKNE